MRDTTIPVARAWNTWSGLPAEMVFLPLGVSLLPVGYAASTGKATRYPAGDAVLLGAHDIDGAFVQLDLRHAGTTLRWTYCKPDPYVVVGAWQTVALGEWGLRFWINLCLRAEDANPVRFDPATGAATVSVGSRWVALVTAEAPVLVTAHASPEALAAQFEANGYFDPTSRAAAGRASEGATLALRFNLEMTRDGRFAIAVADSERLAIQKAQAALAQPAAATPPPLQSGACDGALDAMRDVLAWNTVYDDVNRRPYISLSRNWNQSKFGGFGVWLNDQQYATLMASVLDRELARQNLAVMLASATPQGNLACLITARDAWVDRTQLPAGSFLLWLQHLRTGELAPLELAYATLARNQRWWWTNRDPEGRGLLSLGTSDVGEGFYKGSAFGARNESGMDNAAWHDEGVYDPVTRTLTTIDVGLNSMIALDAECLANMARVLGHVADAAEFADRAQKTAALVREQLWDAERGIFANRLRSGAFVRALGPTSFFPLLAGAATPDQAARLLRWLDDPASFGGPFVIPGTSRADPSFADNTYWRGRIWAPLNFWVWHGLRRAGFRARAERLAEDSHRLFDRVWRERRQCAENYNSTTGEPFDQPDTDGFFTFGALMALMGATRLMDVSPWEGWALVNGADGHAGPQDSPLGQVVVTCRDGWLTLAQGARIVLRTSLGRLTRLQIQPGLIAATIPADTVPGALELPQAVAASVVACLLDGAPLPWRTLGSGIAVALRPGRFTLHLAPAD